MGMFRLRTEKRRRQNERPLWEGVTPAGNCAYYESCYQYLQYKCCPCCYPFTKIKVTTQGIRKLRDPPFCNCACLGTDNDFQDFRLLKSIDHERQRNCVVDKNIMSLAFEGSTDKATASLASTA